MRRGGGASAIAGGARRWAQRTPTRPVRASAHTVHSLKHRAAIMLPRDARPAPVRVRGRSRDRDLPVCAARAPGAAVGERHRRAAAAGRDRDRARRHVRVTVVGFAKALDRLGLGDSVLRAIAIVVLAVFGVALLAPKLATASRRGCRGCSASGRARRAAGSGPAWASARRSASSTRRARARSSPRSSRSAPPGRLVRSRGGRRGLLARLRARAAGPRARRPEAVGPHAARRARPGLPARPRRRAPAHGGGDGLRPRRPLRDLAANTPACSSTRPARSSRRPCVSPWPTCAAAAAASARARPRRTRCRTARPRPAPDFTGTQRWFNTPDGRPLSLAGLRGRVVLLDFWTYTCINCLRTFPSARAGRPLPRDGLTIVGVHTPEFEFEHERRATCRRSRQPPALPGRAGQRLRDLEGVGQRVLARRVPDRRKGTCRYVHFGEGDAARPRPRSAACWPSARRGAAPGWRRRVQAPAGGTRRRRPTSARRARGRVPARRADVRHQDYNGAGRPLPRSSFASGTWKIDGRGREALAARR